MAAQIQQPIRRQVSRPIFRRSVHIQTHQAQQVLYRVERLVARALYSIEVVLDIIADDDEVAAIQEMVQNELSACQEAYTAERDRMKVLIEELGIAEMPDYTAGKDHEFRVGSAAMGSFVTCVQRLDEAVTLFDALWLTGEVKPKERNEKVYDWQQRLVRLGNRIASIERRARAAAERKGKAEEVSEALKGDDEDESGAVTEPDDNESSEGENSGAQAKA